MSTMSELIEQGVTKMRLPFWNEHAYAVPRPTGPWAEVYDVDGEPMAHLIGECDQYDTWETAGGREMRT